MRRRFVSGRGSRSDTIVLILVVNAGSSSLKLRVLDDADKIVHSADVATKEGVADKAAIEATVAPWAGIDAVGHRIVHGGTRFTGPVRITGSVRSELEALSDLAPLHQPKSLAALDAVTEILPDVPAVACFDTAFHATLPAAAATYALPAEWRKRWALRRYGFHGLSHAYIARRTAELLGRDPGGLRLVSCHLGAGASLAAIEHGASVDTTMGFTPLEGLVMATRSGSVDPGLMLWLEEHAHMPPGALAETLEHRSGLLGLSGSADMAVVLTRMADGDDEAGLAFGVYEHRLRAGIASMAASMGGIDALVFTGGVGEHAAMVRGEAAAGLGFVGIDVDDDLNRAAEPDCEIGASDATVKTLVIEAREDLQIALEVRRALRLT
jgi:acetate kinase